MGWVVVWEWDWLGGGRVCLGWDSVRRAVDMVEGRVELVGWSRVGARVSKPSSLLPIYAHSTAKTHISPSKAHMSLERFCCALTIEYKCKTSNINKRL